MIDVKQAVKTSLEYVEALYAPETLYQVGLEEVELSDDGYWYVTVGFGRPERAQSVLQIVPQLLKREYKVVKVDRNTGEVKAMKIREAHGVGR